MNVNITLLLQCINFFITYLFLRYVLFKPAIKIILHEEDLSAKTQHEIAQQEASIAEQFHIRQLSWQEFKKHCQFNKPIQEDLLTPIEIPLFALPKMNEDSCHMKTIINKYTMLIVNHLKHEEHS